MSKQSLAELHDEARWMVSHWPLWLILQRRRIAQHLEQKDEAAPPDYAALLREGGLPLPEQLPDVAAIEPLNVALSGTRFWFEVVPSDETHVLSFARRRLDGVVERCEVLPVAAADGWYVAGVSKRFNKLLNAHGPDITLNAARLWAAYHDASPGALAWELVSEPDATSTIEVPATLSDWG